MQRPTLNALLELEMQISMDGKWQYYPCNGNICRYWCNIRDHMNDVCERLHKWVVGNKPESSNLICGWLYFNFLLHGVRFTWKRPCYLRFPTFILYFNNAQEQVSHAPDRCWRETRLVKKSEAGPTRDLIPSPRGPLVAFLVQRQGSADLRLTSRRRRGLSLSRRRRSSPASSRSSPSSTRARARPTARRWPGSCVRSACPGSSSEPLPWPPAEPPLPLTRSYCIPPCLAPPRSSPSGPLWGRGPTPSAACVRAWAREATVAAAGHARAGGAPAALHREATTSFLRARRKIVEPMVDLRMSAGEGPRQSWCT
jgi:hypothetical protein